MEILVKLRTYYRLGLLNIARVAYYTLLLKSGVLRVRLRPKPPISGEFLLPPSESFKREQQLYIGEAQSITEELLWGHIPLPLDQPPQWQASIFTGKYAVGFNQHWSTLSDFGSSAGDIKGIWEASRFGWLIPMVHNALVADDEKTAQQVRSINQWIGDWSQANPANLGPNWKCAQEASFRVMHLCAAALLLGNDEPSPAAATFIEQHIARILPTLGYAKAQDNNHGTSEAAALYLGASWLLQRYPHSNQWQTLQQRAKGYLTERVLRLVLDDGSFSQYSVTYHRLLLDTVSLVELWRRRYQLPAFSEQYQQRAALAAQWLFACVEPASGDAPNLGANDGAHIVNFFAAPYRDFRYSVELASLLFVRSCAYPGVVHDTVSKRFQLSAKQDLQHQPLHTFNQGGYTVARHHNVLALLRVPVFAFRPSHADVLHLDVWHKNVNLLRDGGSFSYNEKPQWLTYFSGEQSHNVASFDTTPQMPKLSRFLFSHWPHFDYLESKVHDDQSIEFGCACTLWHGGRHLRAVTLHETGLQVVDVLSGINQQGKIRWRLAPLEWKKAGTHLQSGRFSIDVKASVKLAEFTLADGYESRYYGKKDVIPVLEIAVNQDAIITTTIRWN